MKSFFLRVFSITTLLGFFIFSEGIAQKEWQVVSSKVTFKIKNLGLTVDGSFSNLEANIKFDPNDLKNSSITASVPTATINTGNGSRDRHLKAEDYFDAEKYPKLTMSTNNFAKSQSGNFIGYFDVTIKGKTKRITVPFSFKNNTFEGYFTINRRDFEVGGGSAVLSDEAKVEISVTVK